jgi:hypothetical protein
MGDLAGPAEQLLDAALTFYRYGWSAFRLRSAVGALLDRFDAIYGLQDHGTAPPVGNAAVIYLTHNWCPSAGSTFKTPEALLGALGLYNLTQHTLRWAPPRPACPFAAQPSSRRAEHQKSMPTARRKHLVEDLALDQSIVEQLVTAVVRINYGQVPCPCRGSGKSHPSRRFSCVQMLRAGALQDTRVNAFAGMVGLAGSSKDLWSIRNGNWQAGPAAGLAHRDRQGSCGQTRCLRCLRCHFAAVPPLAAR